MTEGSFHSILSRAGRHWMIDSGLPMNNFEGQINDEKKNICIYTKRLVKKKKKSGHKETGKENQTNTCHAM